MNGGIFLSIKQFVYLSHNLYNYENENDICCAMHGVHYSRSNKQGNG